VPWPGPFGWERKFLKGLKTDGTGGRADGSPVWLRARCDRWKGRADLGNRIGESE
jgi:hypothetical protein